MNFCRENLSSRDECRVLTYTLENAHNHLLELALLDVPLMSNKHFYDAMQHIIAASSEVSNLRGAASPISMKDLEEHKHFPELIQGVL